MRTIKMLSLMCMVFLIFTLVSCAQQKNDNVLHQGQQANSDITSLPTDNAEDVPEDNGWRTDEIFDTEKYKGKLQLRFFNLEDETRTGESMLITTPDGINMLIDAGIKKVGPQVIDYLKKLKVEKLDYIVVSHFHSDHIGGMAAVVGEFDVDKIMMCEMPYNTTLKKELDEAVLRKNCEVIYLKEGVFFKLGDEVEIEILNPQAEIVIPEGLDVEGQDGIPFVNNNSIVMRMTYKNNTFLLPADIHEETEKKLIEKAAEKLAADFIKIPHHGVETSSSNEFIKAVSPKIAVMCTNGTFSKYRYDKYRAEGSLVYITCIDGNVLVISDGENISAITEKDRPNNYLK